MLVPNKVFIDTSIFDALAYNMESEKVKSFVEASKAREIVLLLPDPTAREINRHIRERANDALTALREAMRKAPFLRKWKEWPMKRDGFSFDWQILRIAQKEWESFLKEFRVLKLDYSQLNISRVMDWYDKQKAPFGKGKKRKEFPDAMSFAILLQYAQKEKCYIALISCDKDHKDACARYQEFLWFDSLQDFTQTLLSNDQRVQAIQRALETGSGLIEEAIPESFSDIAFSWEYDPSADVEDVKVRTVTVNDTKIIAIGSTQCTIAFDAAVEFSVHVTTNDSEFSGLSGKTDSETEISGIMKLSMGDQWSRIERVDLVTIDQDDVELSGEITENEYPEPWE